LLAAIGCANRTKTVPATVAAPEPPKEVRYNLQFKATPNSAAVYSLRVHSQFTQEIMGKESVVDAGWRAVLKQSTMPADADGNLRIAIAFDSLTVETRDPAVEPMLKPLDGIVGKSVHAILTPMGELKRIHGLEELPAAANQNNQMETTLRSFFPRFAGHATKIGEQWSRQDTTFNKTEVADLAIISRFQYSLIATTGAASTTRLTLHNTGSYSINGSTKNQGIDVGLKGTASTEADFVVDYGDGWLVSAKASTNSSGTAEIHMGQQPTRIPWRSTMTVNILRK
jgi:hypothetical protein